ncbi:dihydrofolate reductase [Pseudonocardia sediminis]|uniref:Dihydrofolate reductase n=1 Tax=Pseudonocardia sediminis TaxID=1397368 RepID=A0A4Q7UUG0_PSEST|nr:dihydrofolate reductase family protein [Pseudonocardia sediminis]RZT83663.1 dihydrofolate reductase [Pseudonocardia sediminis]
MSARVLAQLWISVDGMVAGPDGEFDLFATAPPESIEPGERHNMRLLDDVDVLLLGRRTYESFREVWPTVDHQMAPYLNEAARVVCSTTLEEAPWGDHAPCEVVADGVAWAKEHRAGDGRIALVWGSVALVRGLLAADQLDELELFVAPSLLGDGVPLHGSGSTFLLTLTESEQYPGGVMRLRYARRHE